VLSAIIPTHERPAQLRACLRTLQRQDVGSGELEIIVVDDGSPTDMRIVAATADGPLPVRVERQPSLGLNAARNRGAQAARGEVIAFLDDDTLVSPGWARALLHAFERHPCAAVGGRIRLALEAQAPPWLDACACYLAEYDLGEAPRWLSAEDPVPVGANCAIRRSDFESSGGFRVGLDRIGRSLVSNGDTEFFRRLRTGGARLLYEPAASVRHCVPARRLTVGYFLERHWAQGISDELLMGLEGSRRASPGYLLGLSGEIARSACRMCAAPARRRASVPDLFLLCYWSGRLRGAAREAVIRRRERRAVLRSG
jgi:glycosyltransferase involved in cell wall biosynthesis